MLRHSLIFLVALGASALLEAGGVDAAPETPIYEQDFEGISPGETLPEGVADDGLFANTPAQMRIVDSRDERYGNVLEADINAYGQLILGQLHLEKGKLYRVSLDASTLAGHSPVLLLRDKGKPYKAHAQKIIQTAEEMQRYEFLAQIGNEPNEEAWLLFQLSGHTTARFDNIKVEEIEGPLPAGQPPKPGNHLYNSSFELLGDSWFLRDGDRWQVRPDVGFVESEDSYEGAHAVLLDEGMILNSHWMELSTESDYMVRARVKAMGKPARVRMAMTNFVYRQGASGGARRVFTVDPEEGWQTLSLRFRPQLPAGVIERKARYYLVLSLLPGSDGSEILVDALEVLPWPGGQPREYRPMAPLEFALTTDQPFNTATAGEPVEISLRSTKSIEEDQTLRIFDEDGHLYRSETVPMRGLSGSVTLHSLPPGYWQLKTAPSGDSGSDDGGRIEAESFLAVAPRMPDVPVEDWLLGQHLVANPDFCEAAAKLGFRWTRLHNASLITEWKEVQPDGPDEWQWHDEDLAVLTANGQEPLGLIDSAYGFPDWARALTDYEPARKNIRGQSVWLPEDLVEPWLAYVRAVVTHYKGIIRYWEIINEPLHRMSPQAYAELFRRTVPVIRESNPDAVIVGMGGVRIWDPWILEAANLGIPGQSDILSFHGYGIATWSTTGGPEPLQEKAEALRSELAKVGRGDIPLWNTECGVITSSSYDKYFSPEGQSSARDAALMYPKSMAAHKAIGAERLFLFNGRIKRLTGDAFLTWMTDINGTMTEPTVSTAVAASQLAGRDFIEQRHHADEDGFVELIFEDADTRMAMLWAPRGEHSYSFSSPPREVLNLWGRPVDVGETILLSPEPIYVVWDKSPPPDSAGGE